MTFFLKIESETASRLLAKKRVSEAEKENSPANLENLETPKHVAKSSEKANEEEEFY